MSIKSYLILVCLLIFSTAVAQLDKPQEGIIIKPSDSILMIDFGTLFKLNPVLGLTNKQIERRISYNPINDQFKKTSGVNIVETSKLKKPSWKVNQKFTEDQNNVSQFSKDYFLGDVKTASKTVYIQCRDHEYVDGDRIRLMVNDAVIHPNLTLRGDFYTIDIDLKEGINTIHFVALNEGSSRPNTAQLRVYDENGSLLASNRWLITTGHKASLTIQRQ